MIAIVCAMHKETLALRAAMIESKEIVKGPYAFITGSIASKEVVIVESGIGKVASGVLLATLMNALPDVSVVLNIGVAGGIAGLVKPGDIVIASETAFIDADMTAWGLPRGMIQGLPFPFKADPVLVTKAEELKQAKKGMILSGDTFFTEKEEVERILSSSFSSFKVLALDMESAAFHEAAYLYKVPFLAIRAISDVLGADGQVTSYENMLDEAIAATSRFTLSLLEKL